MAASLPARVEKIHTFLHKVSPALAQRYAVWEVRRWSYWRHGRGVYVLARRSAFSAASLPTKFWMVVEDLFFKFGQEVMHDFEDGIDQAEYKIGGLSLFLYRGRDEWDMLHFGKRHIYTYYIRRGEPDYYGVW